MKKLLLALALIAGTALVGMSPAAADTPPGQFKTNHTVSVPAGETVTYIRSCNASSSHPEGGLAVGGFADFNEPASVPFMEVVSEGVTGDGIGYFTQVKNTADRGYAYLSWATCDPIPPEPEVGPRPDKVHTDETVESAPNCDTGKVTITNTHTKTGWKLNKEGTDWVQRKPVITVTETTRDATAEECPVSIPWTELEPSTPIVPWTPLEPSTPIPTDEPAVDKPVADKPATVKIVTPPATVEQITQPAAQPVPQEAGALPNTGGPNTLYILSGVALLAAGGAALTIARKQSRTN